MKDENMNYDVIPLDDIMDVYAKSNEGVKQAVSILLQTNDQFCLYASNKNIDIARLLCYIENKEHEQGLFFFITDFVERYGHISLFSVLYMFFKTYKTREHMLGTLLDMLEGMLFDKEDEQEVDD